MRSAAATIAGDALGTGQPPAQSDGALVELAVEAADWRGKVLRLQRLHDLADAESGGLQVARPQLHGELAFDAEGAA